MASPPYDLGLLSGNEWRQWADSSGLIYYQNVASQVETLQPPEGLEDRAGDVWARDETKTWPQWNNQRTGGARLTDPNPPPPTNYLQDPFVLARLSQLRKSPQDLQDPERLYRLVMTAILQWCFTSSEGYMMSVMDITHNCRPDFSILRLLARPGGDLYHYHFLMGETRSSWVTFEQHRHTVLADSGSEKMQNIYGLHQVGLEIQLYKYENHEFETIGGRMHLVDDVQDVMTWCQYLKRHPMAVGYPIG